MSRFLPQPARGNNYPIADPSPNEFSRQDASLIQKVGQQMKVDAAASEGRVPSPLSPAYMFYMHLFGSALGSPDATEVRDGAAGNGGGEAAVQVVRQDLRHYNAKAKGALRGICAAFALREVLGLTISLKEFNPKQKEPSKDPKNIRTVLEQCMNTAPGDPKFWNSIRYYTVRSSSGEEMPFAGLSPLTGFFPAATRLAGFTALFWYDNESEEDRQRQWFDPTTEMDPHHEKVRMRVSKEAIEAVRNYVGCWLNHVLANFPSAELTHFGINSDDVGKLRKELRAWRNELGTIDPNAARIPVSSIAARGFPLFNFIVQPTEQVNIVLATELPMHRGRALLSNDLSKSGSLRIMGGMRGSEKLSEKIKKLPPTGKDLAAALGLTSYTTAMPYVVVENLFTPNLALLTTQGLSSEWEALICDTGQQTENYLLPFKPEALNVFSVEEIATNTTATFAGNFYMVVFKFGDALPEPVRDRYADLVATRTYADTPTTDQGTRDATLFDKIDARLFPNFDVQCTVQDNGRAEHLLIRGEDRRYYMRIRRSPYWDFRIETLARDARDADSGIIRRRGTPSWEGEGPDAENAPPSCAEYVIWEDPFKPIGLSVEGRGLCFCQLISPVRPTDALNLWDVAVDFGTSNTCVALKDRMAGRHEVLDFPALTTTMTAFPEYDVPFEPLGARTSKTLNEAGSAVLEFFERINQDYTILVTSESFPTQFVTTQAYPFNPDDLVHPKNGLIALNNIAMADLSISRVIKKFPEVPDEKYKSDAERRFELKDNLKWEKKASNGQGDSNDTGRSNDIDWRESFMAHLRLVIVLTAAKKGARVSRIRFSYPRALPTDRIQSYELLLSRIWESELEGDIRNMLITESEAASKYLLSGNPQNEHIAFDIGGGTTDILAIYNGRPYCQASILLAGRQINDYVKESHVFREVLLKHSRPRIKSGLYRILNCILGDLDQDRGSQRNATTLEMFGFHAWFALLAAVHDRQAELLNKLRDAAEVDTPFRAAVKGYFLSLAVMFGGISFLSGRLLRLRMDHDEAAQQRGLINVSLCLMGNGAKYCEMLETGRAATAHRSVGEIIEALFEAGVQWDRPPLDLHQRVHFDGIPMVGGYRRPPKTLIAVGLLQPGGEDSVNLPIAYDPADIEYYERINPDTYRTLDLPKDVEHFLDNLGTMLSQKSRSSMIPFAPESRGARHSLADELKGVYRDPRVQALVTKRETDNVKALLEARKFATAGHPESVQALEGLFVARVRGLMDGIRVIYGISGGPE